jgi:hypothetical protein
LEVFVLTLARALSGHCDNLAPTAPFTTASRENFKFSTDPAFVAMVPDIVVALHSSGTVGKQNRRKLFEHLSRSACFVRAYLDVFRFE